MTKLTTLLSNQLKNNQTRNIIKDAAMDRWFTGAELQQDVDQLQNLFTAMNLGRGDVVLVCLENSAVFPVINQAAWNLGIIVHPISPTTPIAGLKADWNQFQYPLVLTTDALAEAWTDARFAKSPLKVNTAKMQVIADTKQLEHRTDVDHSEVQDEDLGLILNTSGTTGKPKRVGLSHRIMLNAATHDAESNHMTEADTAMIMMPMFHINAQVMSTLSSRVANARILVTPKFSASRFWQQVADNHVTWVSVVPTIVSFLLLNEKANAAYGRLQSQINLRFVRSSSFALPEERLRAFQDRFHTLIIEGYGMTEASSQCTTNPHDAPKIGSAGLPFGTDVKILIADHFTDAPGALGEIAIKGDHVITHYLDDEKPESFKDGWFLTGDLGYFDEDGYLFVKGRKKRSSLAAVKKSLQPMLNPSYLNCLSSNNKLSSACQMIFTAKKSPLSWFLPHQGSMKPNNAKKSWISAAATWRNLKHPLASNSSVNFHATPLVKSYVRNCGNNYFL